MVRITDPVLRPLRRVIPGFRNLDLAALLVALLVQSAFAWFLAAGAGALAVVGIALFKTVSFMISLLRWSIIITAIASFIAPGSQHPALRLLDEIIEPVVSPLRRILPAMGGLDFSPLVALVALSMLDMILADLFGRFLGSP